MTPCLRVCRVVGYFCILIVLLPERDYVFARGMGSTENFVHGIYREKVPRYRVYRGTCFVIVATRTRNNQTEGETCLS